MVKKKDLEKIERIEKKVTRHDLSIYNKLHRLLKQIYALESKDNVKLYDKIKAKEKEVLRIIKQIRKDAVKELRFAQILRPKNKVQKAIVDIFGPFLSPNPVSLDTTEYVLDNLGVDGLGVGPGGQPQFMIGNTQFPFGEQAYAVGGDPHANLRAFGPALARAEGLPEGSEAFQARTNYVDNALARAFRGELEPSQYRPGGPSPIDAEYSATGV